jgi:hypothetical protein
MPNAVSEEKTLKLFTSEDGEVWFIDGKSYPKASGFSYDEVADKLRIVSVANKPIRIAGGIENVKLISNLYEASKLGKCGHIEVCSPQVSRINIENPSPEKILINMRMWSYPSSVGGFHKMDDKTIVSYLLAREFYDIEEGLVPSNLARLTQLYTRHPCYEFLKFIPFLNAESCMLTVALTLDPRWYVDVSFPNKLHNYYDHMGVGRMLSEAVDVKPPVALLSNLTKIQKRNVVLNSWQTPIDGASNTSNFYDNFLVMTYKDAHKNFCVPKVKPDYAVFDLADLITCQKYLAYVYYTWLDALYDNPPWAERLFVPDLFFLSESETKAFKAKFLRKV